jgi:hypothetical protein
VSNINYGLHTEDDDDPAVGTSVPLNDDVVTSFFKRGREYESVFTNHRYTAEELRVLGSYETLNYLPPDSKVFR